MIASDLVRFGVFAALPFVDSPEGLVVLAGVTGVATGFFFPAANAAIPNLVPEEELANANSLTVTIDTLAMTLGPLVGALLYAAWGPSVPYAVNAVTFLVSAAFVTANPGDEPPLRGPAHTRPLARRRRRVEARRDLPAAAHGADRVERGAARCRRGQRRRGVLREGRARRRRSRIRRSRCGERCRSRDRKLPERSRPREGRAASQLRRFARAHGRGVGRGGAVSGSIWLAVAFVIGGAAGNGSVVVCNRLLVQRGAPDQYRGRALATIMSSNYAVVGLAMAAAAADDRGARAVWIGRRVTSRRRRRAC